MCEAGQKDWIDILSALLTPTIAVLGSFIAWQQWRVNQLRLMHELFDRRYKQFEPTRDFLGTIMTHGRVSPDEEFKWIQATRGSRFLFNNHIAEYFEELFRKSSDLQTLHAVLENLEGDDRAKNLQRQQELKDWFMTELRNLERRFTPYLRLRH